MAKSRSRAYSVGVRSTAFPWTETWRPHEVDHESVLLEDMNCFMRRGMRQLRHPQSRQQLVGVEGLGDIIVGPGIQRGDLSFFVIANGKA